MYSDADIRKIKDIMKKVEWFKKTKINEEKKLKEVVKYLKNYEDYIKKMNIMNAINLINKLKKNGYY